MKISVIVPAYNVGRFIRHCVDSILAQDFDDFEVIVVNDGSTDDTLSILESYQDQRLRIHTQANAGVSAARNAGLWLAQGDYILFVDGDDYIELDTLSVSYECAQQLQADFVISHRFLEYQHQQQIQYCYRPVRDSHSSYAQVDQTYYLLHLIQRKFFHGNSGFLIHHRLAKVNLFPEGISYAEDLYVELLYIVQSKNIAYVNKPLYHYRVGGTGVNSSGVYRLSRSLDLWWVTKKATEIITPVLNEDQLEEALGYLLYWFYQHALTPLLRCSLDNNVVHSQDMNTLLDFFREMIPVILQSKVTQGLIRPKYILALRYLSTKKDNESLVKGIRLVQNILYFGRKKRKLQALHLK